MPFAGVARAFMEAAESSKATIFWKDLWKETASVELKALLRDAQVGKPDAQIKLGHAYRDGDGVDRNTEEAIEWYTSASEEPEALYALGLLHCNGNGVVQISANPRHSSKSLQALALPMPVTRWLCSLGMG